VGPDALFAIAIIWFSLENRDKRSVDIAVVDGLVVGMGRYPRDRRSV
jgi:hypothetical protein